MATIVVRNSRDRSRFAGRRGWIIGERRARRFASTHAAMIFCHEHELDEAEVIVRFGEAGTADVTINLPTEISNTSSITEELDHTTAGV